MSVGPYVGGQLLAQGGANLGSGILSAGEGIAKAISESKKMEEEQGADQVIFNYAKQQGLVTPEIEAQYLKGSHSAKTGIIGGLVRQYAMNIQGEQLKSLKEQRAASIEERGQRTAALKTAQENALLASEPPTIEQQTEASKYGHFYAWNPAKQGYELTEMAGGSSGTKASDKVGVTVQTPAGPQQIMMTGNKAYEVFTSPVKFKQNYNATQTEFSDPRKTQLGVIGEDGKFVPDPNGDQVRYNIHKDKDGTTELDSGVIPAEEWNRVREHASQASQAMAPTGPHPAPSATPTPPRGDVKSSGKVRMRRSDGKVGMVPADQVDDAIKQGYQKL